MAARRGVVARALGFTTVYLTSALVIGPAFRGFGESEIPPVRAPATVEHADHH